MTVVLPTQKTEAVIRPETAKTLLFGPPKLGKTTLCASLDPDHTLFLATEEGQGAMELYKLSVENWTHFREIGAALAQEEHPYRLFVVDTIDELVRQCADDVLGKLGIAHPSDLDWGKGWDAIANEFQLRVGRLAALGGVWFISHSKDVEIKTRVGSITKTVPDIGGRPRKFLIGFCDYIFLLTSELTDDGEQRVLRTAPTENYEAGGRIPGWLPKMADPIVLPAPNKQDRFAPGTALRAEFDRVFGGDQQWTPPKTQPEDVPQQGEAAMNQPPAEEAGHPVANQDDGKPAEGNGRRTRKGRVREPQGTLA